MFQGGGSVKAQVKELCKGSSRDFLNQSILQSVMFPLCSLAEQVDVIKNIEERFSRIDKLVEEIDANGIRIEALRQSILQRAFFGDLVPQDPNDEPASVFVDQVLLEPAERERRQKNDTRKAAA
jgi:type I restriction enzyme S subunit